MIISITLDKDTEFDIMSDEWGCYFVVINEGDKSRIRLYDTKGEAFLKLDRVIQEVRLLNKTIKERKEDAST